jgi:hypothetical protein
MNFSFLDDLFGGLGRGLADVDKFVDREMPFDSGWGFPAALTAAYFAPQLIPAFAEGGAGLGAAEGAGAVGAEGSIGAGGMNSLLSSLGLEGGSMAGQEAFQLPMQSFTPDYLNSLAQYQGVDAGDRSLLDRLMGNTEQGLYRQEGLAKQASGQTVTDLLKKQAQQKAISQLGQSGSKMQEQNTAQQAEQNRMAQQQAMMRRGQGVDTTTALLSLLQDRQQSRQPKISLI